MTANLEDSAASRWLGKKVLESRLLDDMENLAHWTVFTHGPDEVVDARVTSEVTRAGSVVAEVKLTSERSQDGKHSLRLRNPTRLDKPGPASGRGWGQSGMIRHFDGEDWRSYNRLSLWIFPDCPGHYVAALGLYLHNEGIEKLPAAFGQEGETSLVLRNHEWNHVVWEIGNVARDRVTELEIAYYMSGNEPDGADSVVFDFDRLELERVEPDYVEGWGVWPGRISFSHAGYQTGAVKRAVANDLNAREFRLVDRKTGQAVLRKPIQTVKTHLGDFQVMDFSEIWQPGSYVLQAGGRSTRPFQIGPGTWRESIWKALNFFYSERCGVAIPGVHGPCHRDWLVVHGDKRIVINGGWHDAGDLTQGLGNTGEIVYSLFSLAERLQAQGEDPDLCERLMEEGKWGLDWILKTRFGDGYRDVGSISSRRTNGIIGDFDDVVATARNTPMANFTAAAAEAIAHRVLKDRDPRLAAYCLKMAEADWRFAVEGMSTGEAPNSKDLFQVSFDSAGVVHEAASVGVLASVDLWWATGKELYAEKAREMAKVILESQERRRQDWTTPLTGFFYCSPAKDRILHYCHRGREQGPIMALTRLCQAFPDHPDWMKWYSAVVLYSEYLKTVSKYTEPYEVLPASIFRDDDYLQVPESRRESFRRQVLNGIPLGHGHYLRLFPVWMDYRGHFGTILPQAQALTIAGHLRGDIASTRLSELQLEWVIGRNPFAQSMMWGEGYDFAPQYSPSSGDMVGSLPVGIQTREDKDVPYWPVQSTWTYKEVWVHPVARWIWLMSDLAGPALVEGSAGSVVEFKETVYGHRFTVNPDPATRRFRTMLPEGRYIATCGEIQQSLTCLPGGSYKLDMSPGHALDFRLVCRKSEAGEVTIQLTAQGNGSHRFTLRSENLELDDAVKELNLRPGVEGTLAWRAKIQSPDTPWVAVVVPDNDLFRRMELTGVP